MEKKCGEFYGCGEKNGTVQHINACPLSHSTKDVELERVLSEFDKLVIELNANYGTDNYREFITQVYTQAKEAGFKEGVEVEVEVGVTL